MRRRQLISLVAGALAGGGCAGSTRAPAGVSTPPAVVAAPITVAAQDSAMQARWVDTIFAPFARRNEPGCVVGVVRGGQLAIAKGYGAADLYRKIANTPRTPFYVASLSKQFTAMSVVLLAQDGKLSLTDDVRKWIPEVPRLGPITIEQLLNHTSGLRDYYSLLGITGWRPNELFTEATLLDLISRQRALNFTPGSEFLYNNTGYALLGIVVRRASGESLRQFAATRIFKPLGMTHTQFRDDHSQVIDGEAIGYLKTPTGYSVSIPQLDVVGDGGVFTTVEDLAKWDGNLDSGVVGGKAGVGMLQAPGRLSDGTVTGYALGLNVGSYNGARLISHSGSYGGYQSTYMRFPDEHFSVITLCNIGVSSASLAEQVSGLYLPRELRAGDGSLGVVGFLRDRFPTQPSAASGGLRNIPDPDEQVWLEGRYFSDELDMEVTLRSRNSVLVMYRPVGDSLGFRRTTRDQFETSDHVVLQVERDGSGVVSGFLLSTGRVRGLRFVKRTGISSQLWNDSSFDRR